MAQYRHTTNINQITHIQRRGVVPNPPCSSTPALPHQIRPNTASSISSSVFGRVPWTLLRFIPTLMVGAARGQARPQPLMAKLFPQHRCRSPLPKLFSIQPWQATHRAGDVCSFIPASWENPSLLQEWCCCGNLSLKPNIPLSHAGGRWGT